MAGNGLKSLATMKHLRLLFCLAALFLAGPRILPAITVVARDFDGLVARADTVFKGTVTAKKSAWTGEGTARHIVTFVTFQVEETYKGAPASAQTLRFLGGTVGDDTLEVPDLPRFEVGQRAVLFVGNNGKQFFPLVGAAQGRFHVVRDAASGQDRIFADDGAPVARTADIGQVDEAGRARPRSNHAPADGAAMTAESFRAEIVGKVAALAH